MDRVHINAVRLRWFAAALCCAALLGPTPAGAQEERDQQIVKNARPDRSIGQVLVYYLPNRFFDVFDLVRLRVRVGPGVAVRARATEGVDVGLGSYASVFVGLPGPRSSVRVPLPAGLESYSGIELGPGDAELDSSYSPEYSVTEFGASIHAVLIGLDLGVDPFEVVDLLTGFFLVDLRADDF